jgi:hypothetical protein
MLSDLAGLRYKPLSIQQSKLNEMGGGLMKYNHFFDAYAFYSAKVEKNVCSSTLLHV